MATVLITHFIQFGFFSCEKAMGEMQTRADDVEGDSRYNGDLQTEYKRLEDSMDELGQPNTNLERKSSSVMDTGSKKP